MYYNIEQPKSEKLAYLINAEAKLDNQCLMYQGALVSSSTTPELQGQI